MLLAVLLEGAGLAVVEEVGAVPEVAVVAGVGAVSAVEAASAGSDGSARFRFIGGGDMGLFRADR